MTHDYYDALRQRADHWKSYDFRSAAQLQQYAANPAPYGVTYDPVVDAAKVTIPPFYPTAILNGAVTAEATMLPIASVNASLYPPGRTMKIGAELLSVVTRVSATEIEVSRGAFGTIPSAHASGAQVFHATNSLRNQVRLPLGTEDGHVYFCTWDSYWTSSYLGLRFQHKGFQFTSGSRDGNAIWLEAQATYDRPTFPGPTYVGTHQYRAYNRPDGPADWSLSDGNQVGPGTKLDPFGPQTPYGIRTETWTRFFLRIEQRANDYDRVDAWVADETHDAVRIMDGLLLSVRPEGPKPFSISEFWVEMNSSDDILRRLDQRDLVSYVRNFVALRDPGDVTPLLLRPLAGVPIPPTDPPQPPDTPRPDTMKNPRKVIFRHDDRASATGYEIDAVDSADRVVRTITTGLGSVNDQGEVEVDVNVMPTPMGTYAFIVRAMSAEIASDPSPKSEPWQRAPGAPGQPRAA